VVVVFNSSSLASLCSIAFLSLSCFLLLLAPMGAAERFVEFSTHPQACKSTASFLATATAARFFEFLAPREAIFSP
jgi:hypothetical protein